MKEILWIETECSLKEKNLILSGSNFAFWGAIPCLLVSMPTFLVSVENLILLEDNTAFVLFPAGANLEAQDLFIAETIKDIFGSAFLFLWQNSLP